MGAMGQFSRWRRLGSDGYNVTVLLELFGLAFVNCFILRCFLNQYRYGEPMVRVNGLADTHYETM